MEAIPAGPLALIFGANSTLLTKAFDGVTDAQLWQRPLPDSNPLLWVAGHMVTVRAAVLTLLGDAADTGWGRAFARGATLDAVAQYPAKDDVLRVHDDLAARLQERLAALTLEDLTRDAIAGPKPFAVRSVGDQIGFFAFHDSYHLGQLGYIRKALGLSNLVG